MNLSLNRTRSDPYGQNNMHVATLFKWIKIHLNSVMLIKAKREGMKMKVEHFSSYSSVLLLLLSCYSCILFLHVCMLELGDKANYFFPVFPTPSFSFFFFYFSIVHVNTGDMEVQKKKKLRASGYCAVKSSLELLLLPLRCKRSNQWGPWTVNFIFYFTKQLKSAVYLKRNRSRINKRILRIV